MSKQDRQGARSVSELEYKYGQRFLKVMGIAEESRKTAEEAKKAVEGLNSEEIFNRLTDNGAAQGIYRSGGDIYINASYIKSGELLADLIKAGVIRSVDGRMEINLDDGSLRFASDDTDCGDLEFAYGLLQILDPTGLNRAMVGTVYDLNKHQYSYEMTVKAGTALAVAGVTADDDDVYFVAPKRAGSYEVGDYPAVRWAVSNGVHYLTTAASPMMADKFLPVTESADYAGCYTTDIGGVTEWINPPMAAGVEYRTTDRHKGKPVYTKTIDFGTLPNTASKTVASECSISELVSIDATIANTSGTKGSLPYFNTSGTLSARYHMTNAGSIVVTAMSNMSAYSATFTLRYTKA